MKGLDVCIRKYSICTQLRSNFWLHFSFFPLISWRPWVVTFGSSRGLWLRKQTNRRCLRFRMFPAISGDFHFVWVWLKDGKSPKAWTYIQDNCQKYWTPKGLFWSQSPKIVFHKSTNSQQPRTFENERGKNMSRLVPTTAHAVRLRGQKLSDLFVGLVFFIAIHTFPSCSLLCTILCNGMFGRKLYMGSRNTAAKWSGLTGCSSFDLQSLN